MIAHFNALSWLNGVPKYNVDDCDSYVPLIITDADVWYTSNALLGFVVPMPTFPFLFILIVSVVPFVWKEIAFPDIVGPMPVWFQNDAVDVVPGLVDVPVINNAPEFIVNFWDGLVIPIPTLVLSTVKTSVVRSGDTVDRIDLMQNRASISSWKSKANL